MHIHLAQSNKELQSSLESSGIEFQDQRFEQ
jgi:hypothetical protein